MAESPEKSRKLSETSKSSTESSGFLNQMNNLNLSDSKISNASSENIHIPKPIKANPYVSVQNIINAKDKLTQISDFVNLNQQIPTNPI